MVGGSDIALLHGARWNLGTCIPECPREADTAGPAGHAWEGTCPGQGPMQLSDAGHTPLGGGGGLVFRKICVWFHLAGEWSARGSPEGPCPSFSRPTGHQTPSQEGYQQSLLGRPARPKRNVGKHDSSEAEHHARVPCAWQELGPSRQIAVDILVFSPLPSLDKARCQHAKERDRGQQRRGPHRQE